MTGTQPAGRSAWLTLVTIVAVGTGLLVSVLEGNLHAEVTENVAVAGETDTVLIPVEGMSCAVCAAKVKKALQSIDGVQEAKIDLARREARVRYVEDKVSPEQLVRAINQLGYKAGPPVSEEAP